MLRENSVDRETRARATEHPRVLTESVLLDGRDARYELAAQALLVPSSAANRPIDETTEDGCKSLLRLWLHKTLDKTLAFQTARPVDGSGDDLWRQDVWTAELDAVYIEDITRKTGNFKRFSVFVEMLLLSMKKTNPAVYLDIMTPDDLDALRPSHDMRMGNDHNEHQQSPVKARRYLILTYAVAFDRVYYPIPLTYTPTYEKPAVLIDMLKASKLQQEALQEENAHLNTLLDRLMVERDSNDLPKTSRQPASVTRNTQSTRLRSSSLFPQPNVMNTASVVIDHTHISPQIRKPSKSGSSVSMTEPEMERLRIELDLVTRQLESIQNEAHHWKTRFIELERVKSTSGVPITPPKSSRDNERYMKPPRSKPRASPIRQPSTSVTVTGASPNRSSTQIKSIKRPVSTYVPVPSEPLRSYSNRRHASASRDSPLIQFQRFDPTAWSRARNDKLMQQTRQLSRSRSIVSTTSSRSDQSTGSSRYSQTRNSRPTTSYNPLGGHVSARAAKKLSPSTVPRVACSPTTSSHSDWHLSRGKLQEHHQRYSRQQQQHQTSRKTNARSQSRDIEERLSQLTEFLRKAREEVAI